MLFAGTKNSLGRIINLITKPTFQCTVVLSQVLTNHIKFIVLIVGKLWELLFR